MNTTGTGASAAAELEANRLIAAENARRDARGMAFLVGMVTAGALAVVATLGLVSSPASADLSGAPISAP